jgi:hypothetical protein
MRKKLIITDPSLSPKIYELALYVVIHANFFVNNSETGGLKSQSAQVGIPHEPKDSKA